MKYITMEDLKEKLGYKKSYRPRTGTLGRAMVEALIKELKEGNHRSVGWLKYQLDELYKKDKHRFNKKKGRNAKNRR